MTENLRHYADERIDITYDAERCIHVAECLRGLPAVFDTARRPWVLPSGASADAIAEVIERCPSGALHYTRLDGGPNEAAPDHTTITPRRRGPLYVRGDLEIRLPDGTVIKDTRATLCRCGLSDNKPFCDNSHRRSNFDDEPIEQLIAGARPA